MDTLTTNQSLDPIKHWVKEIAEQDEQQRQLAANYISLMADEAESLARVWNEVVNQLEDVNYVDLRDNTDLRKEIERHRWGQMPHYYRLHEFYRYLGAITKSALSKQYADNVVLRIPSIFSEREITKERYDQAIEQLSTTVLVDKTVRDLNISNLRQSVDALYREAAGIDALAEAVRSFPKAGRQRVRPSLIAVLVLSAMIANNIVWILLLI